MGKGHGSTECLPYHTQSLTPPCAARAFRGFRKTTTRLVLVPLSLLSTPQQLAVLVNF